MPYTNNVPQANQTIAQTTTPIRNNFAFIEDSLKVEHIFNGDLTQAEGTHIKASMPDIALNPPLGTGKNGVYYVSGGNAHYYNGTKDFLLSSAFPVNAAVNFDGLGGNNTDMVINSSFNVSSVRRTAAGLYTVNFTTPMASANYVVLGMAMRNAANQFVSVMVQSSATYSDSITTTFVKINTKSQSNANNEVLMCSIVVMGG